MQEVRPAAVAGLFYPASRAELRREVDALLHEAEDTVTDDAADDAYVLPHAGYVYSGTTAARGYARLARRRDSVSRVVLLGPTHRVPLRGLGTLAVAWFETPLGRVPVAPIDREIARSLPQLVDGAAAHAPEHSVEVHVPFLQRALGDFELVPLAVGQASPDDVADVIEALAGGPDTVVIVSSDLSHYHAYDQARRIDEATVQDLLARRYPITHEQACGATPTNGLVAQAIRKDWQPHLLGMCNSGDTAGDRRRVVGYAALAWR